MKDELRTDEGRIDNDDPIWEGLDEAERELYRHASQELKDAIEFIEDQQQEPTSEEGIIHNPVPKDEIGALFTEIARLEEALALIEMIHEQAEWRIRREKLRQKLREGPSSPIWESDM